jgi:hypothetical protein
MVKSAFSRKEEKKKEEKITHKWSGLFEGAYIRNPI